MNGREFYSMQYTELNAIRAQSEKDVGINAFKITESGLIPVDENDDDCDVVFGCSAIHFYISSHAKNTARQPLASSKTPDVFRLLAQLPELEVLSYAELDQLASTALHHQYPPNAIIVKQGDAGSSLFVLSQGSVRVYSEATDTEPEKTLATLAPGAYFGEMSLLTGAPRSATLVTNTETIAYEITKDNLKPFISDNEELLKALSQHMAERQLSVVHKEFLENLIKTEEEKLTCTFSSKLKEFFGLKSSENG